HKVCFLRERVILNVLLAGMFVFFSTLTKGVQGAFPLAAVFLYWAVDYKRFSFVRMVLNSLLLLSVPAAIYGILFLVQPESLESWKTYFSIRFVNTFNNVGATTENRFELLIRLLNELIPLIAISVIVLFFSRKQQKREEHEQQKKLVLWFLLIGLSGVLSIMKCFRDAIS
ncbi:MAG: hypothetical protein ACK4HV_05335, partial [Parachlamydiaceae bacterium]